MYYTIYMYSITIYYLYETSNLKKKKKERLFKVEKCLSVISCWFSINCFN